MKKTKRNGHNGKQPAITAKEAVCILQSAIGYCQQARMAVKAYNSPDGVTLTLPGVYYTLTNDGTSAEFHIGTAPADDGTPNALKSNHRVPQAQDNGTSEAAISAPG